ncbi:MAG: SMI1/KNR4 family protein [Gemmatimonadetes bacterium]|nr:SMI1/KNR4 family protein [Gemmatimonadota bacterium]MYB58411.1 SMI1/KNR4 family protein [Gemmatimonadota bacterium]
MTLEWKYAEPLDESQLSKIEDHFGLSLPQDYKKSLAECNLGKPSLERFDTEFKKECVLDYMIDLSDTVSLAKTMSADYGIENLIPVGRDPFGNLITFKIADGQVDSVVFWDHETNKISKISGSFTEFIEKLY